MPDLVSGLGVPSSNAAQLPADDPRALAQARVTPPQRPQLSVPDWFHPIWQQIRQGEGTSQGSGMVFYGGAPIPNPGHDFPDWPGATGPSGQPTHAAGPGQWQPGTWAIEAKRAKAQGVDLNFSDASIGGHQEWAAYDRSDQVYKDRTGRSMQEDKQNGTFNIAALSSEWQSLGGTDRAAVATELHNNMYGSPSSGAREFSNEMIKSVQAAEARYDAAMRKADQLSDFAMASERKMLEAAMQPPRNSHEAWQTWGGAASLLALVGGLAGGRDFTASLAAAGSMMEAAGQADRANYDRAWQQFRDQRDFGFKGIELLVRESNEAIARAGADYNHQLAALRDISSAYQLPRTLDHQMLSDVSEKLRIEGQMAEWHDRNNDKANERLAVDELNAEWSRQNGGAAVPATVNNANIAKVRQQLTGQGAAGTFQILTDPTNNQQYRYNPQTGEATTLDLKPYTPGGAARLGGAGASGPPVSDQTVEFWANVLNHGGSLPAGLARGASGAQLVQRIMAKVGETGDPGKFLADRATVKADSASLANLKKMTDAAVSFENTAIKNFDVALKLSKNAVPTDWGPWLNKWIETGETQFGNTDVPPYVTAMLTGASEYAKIMSGSTGAQGATVDSRREAAELFSPYLSKGQIERVVAVAKTDMENRKQSLHTQIDEITTEIRNVGSGAPATPSASAGGVSALPADLPSPAGHAEGSVAKDDSGKGGGADS
jgi:hypothetical protein